MKSDLHEVHEAELELTNEFSNFCNNNRLNYFMIGGTLLGAIRHKGFIPWDDDMDFGMLRGDYEKLLNLLLKENNDFKYSVAHYSNGTSLDYPLKLENNRIILVDTANETRRERAVWIDVFPIDGMPNNKILRKLHAFHLLYLRLMFKYSKFSENVALNANIKRSFIESALINVGKVIKPEKFLNRNNWANRLDKSLKRYSPNNHQYAVNFMGAYKFKEMFLTSIYSELSFFNFENRKISGIKNYDVYLTQMYGNYRLIPGKTHRNKHKTEIKKLNN